MSEENNNLMKTPKSIEIDITGRCNLRCAYCSHFESAGDVNTDLPAEEWLNFFKELNECAVMDVTLSGGEPFIREDIKVIIDGIVKNRMRFSILSNGTLITDDISRFLADTRRCNYVQVSIDGSVPETHDIMRGEGSFAKAVRGLKLLLKNKIDAKVRVTIHKYNYNRLEEVAKLLLEDIGLSSFSTNSASHMGLCKKNMGLTQLTAAEFSFAMEDLIRLNKKYKNRISGQAGPFASALQWLKMGKARKTGDSSIEGGFLRSCGGAFSKLAVRSDGMIVPCIQIGHIELGRINKVKLKEVWTNHPELKNLRSRKNIPLTQFSYCRDCEYVKFCYGGCPATAYTFTEKTNSPSPAIDSCLRRFLEAGGKLPEGE